MKTNRTKKVFVFINNKGGVGKSRSAVALSEYFSARGLPYKAIDADCEPGRSGTLKRFLPEAEEVVAPTDKTGRRLWDRLLLATDESPIVIADLPGGASAHFVAWFATSDVLASLEAADIEIVMMVPICENRDSLVGLRKLWDDIGADAQVGLSWVVIRNEKDGETSFFECSKIREDILASGGREMTFEAFNFDPEVNRALDCSRGDQDKVEYLTFSQLMQSKRFTFLQVARLRNFQKKLFEQFAAVGV